MAFVPHYDYDIFVSYAHVDDEPLAGADKGWISTLISCVKTRLAQILGRSDAYSLWMDHELASHVKITPQIMDTLSRTATLIIVLSPGYVASEWCKREKDTFLNLVKECGGSRVFVVERDMVEEHERPSELSDLKGFKFWRRDREGKPPRILGSPKPEYPADREYYNLVDDLSHELATELRSLKVAAGPTDTAVTETTHPEQPTVFLAQVTDDLETERNNVKRYLKQVGINVLPDTWYRQEPNAFRETAQRDLAACELFVQLLSGVGGRKPPDLPQGYVKLQIGLARTAGIPVLQWRSPALELANVEEEEHRAILDGNTVRAEAIEDFKREIRSRLLEKPAPEPKLSAFVFVNMETPDRPLAEEVCSVLDAYGADYVLPVESDNPAENRRDLEQNLLTCDGVIVIYGASTVTWVRRQLLECRKILVGRERPLRAFAVIEGPPQEKDRLDLKIHNLQFINCRHGLDEAKLKVFLGSLR